MSTFWKLFTVIAVSSLVITTIHDLKLNHDLNKEEEAIARRKAFDEGWETGYRTGYNLGLTRTH